MNYGEIKQKILEYSHRTDLADQVDSFVQDAAERIGRRFGEMPAPLVADTDSNSTLTTHPLLYQYAALCALGEYTTNVEAAQYWEAKFNEECNRMNINYQGLDWAACDGPVMCPDDTGCPSD